MKEDAIPPKRQGFLGNGNHLSEGEEREKKNTVDTYLKKLHLKISYLF